MSALNWTAISAVARRQLGGQLGNPLGYVFILAFVLVASALMFMFGGEKFFARNIADLQPLVQGQAFAWLLVGLLPALAMSAWAGEREHGTEEQLLTLPLTITDAVIGKWLAIVVFFTLALACSVSNVVVLAWQGSPDLGLAAATYLGWWLAGLVFAALGLLASVLVALPAVAFVLGVAFCAVAMWGMVNFEFFDGFGRGVVPTSSVVTALAAVGGALGAAILVLASRRWRPDSGPVVVSNILALLFGLVLVANIARLGAKHGVDADISDEGLSSLAPASVASVREVQGRVNITAFISRDLPPDLQLKAREVEDKLKALERAAPATVKLDIRRPADALDADGALAAQEFNLKPRRAIVESVSGRRTAEVFLGAAVQSGKNRQVIEHFDPGLSVEYELVRAVRSVANAKKRVLGIATTDLEINGGFNFQAMSSNPAWEIVEEWKKQYDVRSVALDSPVAAEIEVLVVPQPSTLTQPQLENLHDAIWAQAIPTLLLEDPVPFFQLGQGRGDLLPNQPKKSNNPYGGPPQDENAPKKGDFQAIVRALGLEADPASVLWSDYNPSHAFRELIPQNFVWLSRDKGSVDKDSPVTTGISSLLLPFPGAVKVAPGKSPELTVTPLLVPAAGSPWGRNGQAELVDRNWQGQMSFKDLTKVRRRPEAGSAPAMLVAISGKMPSAYPRPDPAAKPPEKKDGEAAAPAPEAKAGVLSAKPVKVVYAADIDFVDNQFFEFYRNSGNRIKDDDFKVLLDLRNVQLLANAVDALFDDKAYLDLRTRKPMERKLERLEAVRLATQAVRREQTELAKNDFERRIEEANAGFQAELSKIDAREDIDEATKAQARQMAQIQGQRKLDAELNRIRLEQEQQERDNSIAMNRDIQAYISWVQRLAVVIPTAVLALVAFAVFIRRLLLERSNIPASRRRTA